MDPRLAPETGFAALRDGAAIMQAQRHVPHSTGTYNVGGWAEIAVVERTGVTVKRLCDWPDRVSERIVLAHFT